MTEEMERKEIISQQIQTNKNLVSIIELLQVEILQNIEMNKLTREILRISGGRSKITMEELDTEMELLISHVEHSSEKAQKIVKQLALPKLE